MKRTWLLGAASIVVLANLFALLHAWRNRSSEVEADITLTQRELALVNRYNDDNSGVVLNLQWLIPYSWRPGFAFERATQWLRPETLKELGFDTSVTPSDATASEFYRRQRARRAFVALEHDGPAWRKHLDDLEHETPENVRQVQGNRINLKEAETRLVPIDAGNDAVQLRSRHPDRSSVVIVPVVIQIMVAASDGNTPNSSPRTASIYGYIQEIPSSIHVPKPFSDAFRNLPRDPAATKYRVHLRYGQSLEPWIVGVEFPEASK